MSDGDIATVPTPRWRVGKLENLAPKIFFPRVHLLRSPRQKRRAFEKNRKNNFSIKICAGKVETNHLHRSQYPKNLTPNFENSYRDLYRLLRFSPSESRKDLQEFRKGAQRSLKANVKIW